jgi:hypothetical protein
MFVNSLGHKGVLFVRSTFSVVGNAMWNMLARIREAVREIFSRMSSLSFSRSEQSSFKGKEKVEKNVELFKKDEKKPASQVLLPLNETDAPKVSFGFFSQIHQAILSAPEWKAQEKNVNAELEHKLSAFTESDFDQIMNSCSHHLEIDELIPGLFLSGEKNDFGIRPFVEQGESSLKPLDENKAVFGAVIRCAEYSKEYNSLIVREGGREIYLQEDKNTVASKEHFVFPLLKRAAILAIDALSKNQTVLIHCRQGKDRSPAVAATVIALIFDTPLVSAFNYVKQKRPIADSYCILNETSFGGLCEAVLEELKNDSEIKTARDKLLHSNR